MINIRKKYKKNIIKRFTWGEYKIRTTNNGRVYGFENTIKCPLCVAYCKESLDFHDCNKCPIWKANKIFKHKGSACILLIIKIIIPEKLFVTLSDETVYISDNNKDKAIEQLDKILKWIEKNIHWT